MNGKISTQKRNPLVLGFAGLLLLLISFQGNIQASLPDQSKDSIDGWQKYTQPEEAGWSSEKLEEARQFSESIGSAAVIVVYKGKVLAAWGNVERRYRCHSVRKSFLSALYGIHIGEGRIDLEKTIEELKIDDLSPLTKPEKQAKISDLLKAKSGIYHSAAKETPEMKQNRPERGSHKPGTYWWYNNWDFNTLSEIFEQETGTKIFEEFKKRIAEPLKMEDFRLQDTFYQYERSLSIHPAYAFRMSVRDMARFGQLFLQGGRWEGKQVLPIGWIKESTASYSHVRQGIGYGYMWWNYARRGFDKDTPYKKLNQYDKFAATGTGGQWILVVPSAEIVIVHRGDTDNNRRVSGRDIWILAEMIFNARVSEAKANPELTELHPIPTQNTFPVPKEHKEIELKPEILEVYEGEYELEPNAIITIRRYGNVLAGSLTGQGEADFFPETESHFFAKVGDFQITFVRNEKGEVTHLIMHYTGQNLSAKKIK